MSGLFFEDEKQDAEPTGFSSIWGDGPQQTSVVSPIPRDFSMSPFNRIRSDLESLVEEGEDDAAAFAARLKSIRAAASVVRTGSATTGGTKTPVSGGLEFVPTRSLWIGNLDPTLTEEDLQKEFAPFGTIESLRLLPSKECAFINYFTVEEAVRARERMQGAALGNMIIRVGFGKTDHSGMLPVVDPGTAMATKSIWVGHIGPEMNVDLLYAAFARFGPIESCRILDTKNCGFVNFYFVEHAMAARKTMNGARIGSSVVKIGFAKSSCLNMSYVGFGGPEIPLTSGPFYSQSSNVYGGYGPNAYGSYGPNAYGIIDGIDGLVSFMESATRPKSEAAAILCTPATTKPPAPNISIFSPTIGSRALASPPLPPPPPATMWCSSSPAFPSDEFSQPIPVLPTNILSLGSDLIHQRIRDYRKHIDHYSYPSPEFDAVAHDIVPSVLPVAIDPIGNILVQKLVERGSEQLRMAVAESIGMYMPAVGIHKNGTWVVQKLICNARQSLLRAALVRLLRPHLVPLLQDQYGNYVAQCCLVFGSEPKEGAAQSNQFVLDALAHNCVEIASSRFGSRAMKSCLESADVSPRQQRTVAMAIIRSAITLAQSQNAIMALQWLLDSDLPDRFSLVAEQLRPFLVTLASSKHASSLVAKLLQQVYEPAVKEIVVDELVYSNPNLGALLQEPMAAAIVLKALSIMPAPAQRLRLAAALREPLRKLASLQLVHLLRLQEEVSAISVGDDRPLADHTPTKISFGSIPASLPTAFPAHITFGPGLVARDQSMMKAASFQRPSP